MDFVETYLGKMFLVLTYHHSSNGTADTAVRTVKSTTLDFVFLLQYTKLKISKKTFQ